MRIGVIVTLLLAIILVPVLQAGKSEWQNLGRIQPEDRVQVVDQQMKSYTGKFVRFSEAGLTLVELGKEVTIPKDGVYRVTVVSRGRGRHVLRGLLIGTAVGVGIGAIAGAPKSAADSRAGLVAGGALAGAGIGSLVGVAKSPHIPIYQAKRTQRK